METKITDLLPKISQLLMSMKAAKTNTQEKEEQPPKLREEAHLRLPKSIVRRMQELPMFNGTDSPRWIVRMEMFFEFNPVDDIAEMMNIIALCMSDEALAWFQCIEKWKNPPGSWNEFRHALYERFEGGRTMYEWFLSLQQEGTVKDYCRQFELLGALLPDIPDCILEAKFMNGLTPVIRSEVRMLQPKGILEIMERARLVEDKNNIIIARN